MIFSKSLSSTKTLGEGESTGTFAKGPSKKQGQALQGDGPWLVLQKTVGKKPERAYVLGTKVAGLKPRLIVEVTKTMSKKYSWVLDRVIDSLRKENLSKPEAIALREKMCKQYPWEKGRSKKQHKLCKKVPLKRACFCTGTFAKRNL